MTIKNLLLVSLLAAFVLGGTVQAQTTELPDPGMLPDNPLYFFKSWGEGIGTFFAFGGVAKAERFLNLAERRLAEANALAERGKPDIAARSVERYEEQLARALARADEARENGLDTDEVLAKVSEATLKHQEVLAGVYERVPEQAKPAIERAMQSGLRGHEEALQAISGEKREEALQEADQRRQEVEERLEGLRNQGVPIPAMPTRQEIEQRIPAAPAGPSGGETQERGPGAGQTEEEGEEGAQGGAPELPQIPGGRP
ncbi:MAG: DUF5667 domain-containing protein [Candidatus Yanofskybacteria bacterium]|nr:DUF5667 domain-containing protein [Candidatus Yanofskybacteria bacterium]